jgi:hypothetical protein
MEAVAWSFEPFIRCALWLVVLGALLAALVSIRNRSRRR